MQVAGMIRARSLRRVAHALSCTIVGVMSPLVFFFAFSRVEAFLAICTYLRGGRRVSAPRSCGEARACAHILQFLVQDSERLQLASVISLHVCRPHAAAFRAIPMRVSPRVLAADIAVREGRACWEASRFCVGEERGRREGGATNH